MKRNLLFILVTLVSMMGTRIAVNAQNLTLSDVQNSGCLRENQRRANGEGQTRTIVLLKEGNILSVQLLNYEANCGTEGFDVTPNMSGGSDGTQCSVNIQVVPVGEEDMDCICPYNVSFTVYGLETNSFRFNCWWFVGQVSLTEGEPLTLESITEPVKIDEWYCIIDKVNHTAIVRGVEGATSELLIPWVLSYEGEEYYVTGIGEHAFINYKALTSVTLPTNLTHIGDYAFAGCDNLTDVYCFADKVPTTGSNVFHGTPIASATLHVPAGMVDKYKATSPWSNFGNIVGEGEVTIDGLNYYLNSSFYTAPLTKGNTWEGELDIPSEISFYGQTYRVTSMDRNAFRDNTKLTKVRIPKSLEGILHGYYTTNPYEDVPTGLVSPDHMNPFRGCTALESIEVDEENPSLKSVDGVLFSQDGKGYYYYLTNSYYGTGLYCYPAGARRESYTIPNGVEWIGSGAFGHNQYISTLTIPSSMKMMYYSVFAGCSNLKDIYCNAENVPVAFSFEDFPISSATLHVPAGSVEKYKATSPWSSFGNIVALPAVANEYIDPQTNVVYTYEPGQGTASVKAGYEEAQSTGFGEGEVFFYSGSPDAEGDIVILDRFSVGTEEYVVTRIGEGAFRENSKIKSVSIPETVTDIGKLAFCWCDSLTSVQLPSGLTKIAPWLFCCCNQLMSVTIPSSVSTIGERAFADCGSLANITLPESLTSIGYGVFSNCYFVADSFINKSTLTSSNKWGATLCDMETSEGLMLKDNGVVFCRPWTWINSVTIPNGVTSIEKNAFMDRSGLTSVTIPYSVTSIGEDAFLRCFGLSSVTIPSSVTKIGNSAFCLCYGLTSVTIGSGMASIGAGAFYECRNLRNVCCYAEDVPDTGINTFEGLPIASATLHVPAGSVDSYKAVSPWNEFGNIVAIEEIAQEYFPEGTKWTEIRLDTLKYDSWYSKIGDEWVPNFETIEYRVQGIYSNFSETFGDNSLKCVYTNCSEWTDSLSLLIIEGEINEYLNYGRRVMATVPIYFDTWDVPSPAMAYNFDWRVGMPISFIDILSTTYDHNSETAVFGIIEEINEGNFGGVRPLNYTDVNGVRIIQGIGVTTWNDGECIFGPVRPYDAMAFHQGIVYPERHYRSMLVHFERDGEVLYNVWPEKEAATEVTYTKDQMATIILPTEPNASKGKYYRLDRCENEQIIFEQELQPQARIPYIIVPSEDFSIDPSTLDLEGLTQDAVSIEGISFIGTYIDAVLPSLGGDGGGSYYDIIDKTPDCGLSSLGETGKGAFVGALRAYLTVKWDDPYNHPGSKGPDDKLPIVLKDYGTGVDQMVNPEWSNGKCYDLQGRRLFGKPAKGLYIEDGRIRH